MAEDDFFVAAVKFRTVEISIKERVRHLFGVDISVIFDDVPEDRFENAQVHLSSTSNSAKCKTQIYLQAALEEGKTFMKQKLSFNAEEFKMLLNDYDNIERRSQTVLMYLQDKNEISIQGSPNNVALAQYYINDIINRRPDDIATDSLIEDNCEQRLNSSINDNNNVIMSSSLSMNKLHLTPSDRLSARGSEHYEGSTTLDSIECDSCLFASPPTDKKHPEFSVGSSSSCSSPENETDTILLDPEHSSHIEKALRLGYSEIQIVAVLKKLGTTVASVDPNTLLSELIKQGAMTPDVASNDSPVSSLTNDYGSLVEDSVDEMDTENADDASNLKHIVIDGSNVAMSHGNKEVFSCRGIQLAVDYFRERGHQKITVFVPQWRKESSRPDAQINDQEIIRQLEKEKVLVFTPSRRIGGRRVVCYDDRFILELAHAKNGIVVSNDNYRDLHNEKSQYKKVAEEQLLQYVFVDDRFMPPEDPLGKYGPTLDNYLRIKRVVSEPLQPCPYGKKCTYGNKCRFAHPERGNKPQRSVTDLLSEQSNQKLKDRAVKLEEKKKKDITKKKQALRRTKSLFPDEPSFEPRTHYQSESLSEDTTSNNTSRGPIKPDLNDTLNEHRLKLDEAIRKSREASPVPAVEVKRVSSLLNQSSLINVESQVIELEPFRSTPILSQNSQANQERLVSGHLDLAKKLSDDAQDTSFFDSEKGSQSLVVSSTQQQVFPFQQTPQQFLTSDNRYMASPAYPGHLGHPGHPGLQQEPTAAPPYRYQAPRPTPVEYGTCFSGPSTYLRPNPSPLSYEEHIRSYPFTEHDTQYMYVKSPWDQHHPSAPGPVYSSDHLSLGSRQSYPEHLSPTHGNPMMRQNSSSDPQINQVSNYPRQEHDMNRIRDRGNKVMTRSTSIQSPSVNQHNVPYSRQVSEMMYPSNSVCMPQPRSPFNQAEWGNVQRNFVNPYGMPPIQSMLPQRQPLHPQVVPIHQTQPTVHQLDAEITPKDSRYGLYTQLCGLFPEPKVRTVMNKYPGEKDPHILCAYIISINQRP